ncbi:ATP-binding protein [Phyllobacterium pellucidum]|uniref:ATP-binding protein n=1 Tax=Phyllobacterium pellucidum TaxID=2740464 RepID=UPI001D14F6AE|nr:ATP-binding protein [Phyllobacterium sp. T1018]UGY09212.1 ATP-binding protein [Phyllobacterium sp. T1018]
MSDIPAPVSETATGGTKPTLGASVASQTDTLVKPDMVAVLSRTHIGSDLHAFLLPTLEAVSNAIHGIKSRFGDRADAEGKIEIRIMNSNDPSKILISITDNGIGLNDSNYESFKTPFSGLKLKERGRGFGRFIAFKVFSRILYSTRYEFLGVGNTRTFRFDVSQKDELIFFDGMPDFPHVGMRVEYDQPLSTWYDLLRELDRSVLADHIAGHFLPHFLYGWLPEITIKFDEEEPENITSRFKSVFVETDKGQVDVEIEGIIETLEYSLTRVPRTRLFKNHCLLFTAADRIVGSPKDLSNLLGQPHFTNEKNEHYVVIAVVRGEAFETRLNDARTGINLSPKAVEQVVSAIGDVIQRGESRQIEKIKSTQSSDLSGALQENPILRLGLRGRTVKEYVSAKPNNWTAQQFVADLAIERYRASKDLSKAITSAAASAENYIENIKDIVSKVDENNKEALAEYVIHRKNVIELVETARKYTDGTKHPPEDVIHDLIFKRFSDTVKHEYFEHNLWLIDDALAFLPYVSSDRTAKGAGRQKGDKVPDLAFFDDSLVLGDNDGTTVTIVEFKKPSRDNYSFGPSKTDPVKQVLETLELAVRAGGVTRTDGTHMSFSGLIRRFGYIVADHTPTLVEVLRTHDFVSDQNPRIFYRYRANEKILIQAIGYDTLIENAKKRNQAFFSVLLGE